MRNNAGFTVEEQKLLETLIKPEEREKRKADFKRIKERVNDKYGTNVMHFYDKVISEDRRKELSD